MKNDYILCSECFKDFGLRLEAENFGVKNKKTCPNCDSHRGFKLTKEQLNELCFSFFVQNSSYKAIYGGAPLIQYNEAHFNLDDDIDFSKFIQEDIELFRKHLKIGFFYYGPRLCYLGENTPLKSFLQHGNSKECKEALKTLLEHSEIKYYDENNIFYRLRKNPADPFKESEYDSAPKGTGRFNDSGFKLMYASNDIETCVHECRVKMNDELYMVTLKPTKKLKLLDLTKINDPYEYDLFESFDYAMNLLFNADKNSYTACRKIAKYIARFKFDGLLSNSYFNNYLKKKTINVTLFGNPIKEGKVKIIGINRLFVNKMHYDISFGPTVD